MTEQIMTDQMPGDNQKPATNQHTNDSARSDAIYLYHYAVPVSLLARYASACNGLHLLDAGCGNTRTLATLINVLKEGVHLSIDIDFSQDHAFLAQVCCPYLSTVEFPTIRAVDVQPFALRQTLATLSHVQAIQGNVLEVPVVANTAMLLIWPHPENEFDMAAIERHKPRVLVTLVGYFYEQQDDAVACCPAAGSLTYHNSYLGAPQDCVSVTSEGLTTDAPPEYVLQRRMRIRLKDGKRHADDDYELSDQTRQFFKQTIYMDDVYFVLSLFCHRDYHLSADLLNNIPEGNLTTPSACGP
jgi:hypothetical protein